MPVGVVAVVAVVVVGSGAVWVGTLAEGPACVRTSVSLAELESSASQTAETTPATIATTSASSAGQIQSPGYQPARRRQPAPSRATSARPRRQPLAALEAVLLAVAVRRAAARAAPVVLGLRHSALPGIGRVQDRLVDRLVPALRPPARLRPPVRPRPPARSRRSSRPAGRSGRRRWRRPRADARSPRRRRPARRRPAARSSRRSASPTGTGAPHSQVAGARRAVATASSIESSSRSRSSSATISRHCSISSWSRKLERRYISSVSPPRWRIRSSRAFTIARRSRLSAPGDGARRKTGCGPAAAPLLDRRV